MFDKFGAGAYNRNVNQYYISNAKEKAFAQSLQKKLPRLRAAWYGKCPDHLQTMLRTDSRRHRIPALTVTEWAAKCSQLGWNRG